LKALAVALERFGMEEVKSDLANFSVDVNNLPPSFELVFVPLPYPDSRPSRGGGNEFGREIHNKVSSETDSVVQKSFAKRPDAVEDIWFARNL
jgi:hypothetical protein